MAIGNRAFSADPQIVAEFTRAYVEGMHAAEMAATLAHVTFHNQLGTQAERIARIAALAREIAPAVGADSDLAERAAKLSEADLAS